MALAFGLQLAGFTPEELSTEAAVTLKPEGKEFKINKSALTLRAKVPNLDEAGFARIAGEAEKNCPVSLVEKTPDADLLRDDRLCRSHRLMGLEVEGLTGAADGEKGQERQVQRNGYRDRSWETRAGTIELRIPKLRHLGVKIRCEAYRYRNRREPRCGRGRASRWSARFGMKVQ